jgi:hypothetical protein
MDTTARTRRPLRSAAAAILIALLAATAAHPATASYYGEDDPGEGGGGGGGTTTNVAEVFCHEGDAWYVTGSSSHLTIPQSGGLRGYVWLLRPNNMCPNLKISAARTASAPRGTFGGKINLRQVGHGWEVWRFYGTPDQVLGLSVSYAGTPTWGSGAQVVTVAPHPDDHSAVPAGTLPWRQSSYTSTGRDFITLFEGGSPTTNPPFRFVDARCSSLLPRRDPVALAMADNPERTRDSLFADYQSVSSGFSGPAPWRVGVAAINARNTGPISSPAAILTGDTRPCTSPYEYATYTPAEGLSLAGVATGVCIMPLTRVQLQLSDGSWATLRRYSHRYATSYGRAPADDRYTLWRNALHAEVLNRTNSPYMLGGALRPSDRGRTPSQPSAVRDSSPYVPAYNNRQAADAARDYANCREGMPELTNPPGPGEVPDVPRITLQLEVPEVFQLGGGLRPNQTIEVRHTPYTCEGGLPCPVRSARQSVSGRTLPLTPDHLSSLSYRLEVSSNGLRLCTTSSRAERCDWRMNGPAQTRGATWSLAQPAGEPRSPDAQTTAASNWERVQTTRKEFYSATNPGEAVFARVTDVSANYATYSWGTRQIGVTACYEHADGERVGTRTGNSPNYPLRQRNTNQPYLQDTPPGTVSQWYLVDRWDYTIEHYTVQGDGTFGPEKRKEGYTEYVGFRQEREYISQPRWVCPTAVLDDWEVSAERPIPSSQISIPRVARRPVIGVVQR